MRIKVTQPWGTADLTWSNKLASRLDRIGNDSVRFFAKNFLSANTIPAPHEILIETHNRCNNDCPFCPVNRNNDTRKPHVMEEDLFYFIIDQLNCMNYRGCISLYSNNEPLLDGRIFKFVEYAKNRLPHAKHILYTNGILLTCEKLLSLIQYLDLLVIDNYDDDLKLTPPIAKTMSDFKKLSPDLYKDSNCEIEIAMRKKNQKLSTRGGKSPNRVNETNMFRGMSTCVSPFFQMNIRPNGTVDKCCQDPLGDISLGDLNKQTLREVWQGAAYKNFRREMYFHGRKNIAGCEFCDYFGIDTNSLPNAFSKERERLANEIAFRKNLGKVYLFDTTQQSQEFFHKMKLFGVEFDGFININDDKPQGDYKFVTLEQAVNERAFIFFAHAAYPDELFDMLHNLGYRYGEDYIIIQHAV